jgi:hypothetical protein
MRTRVIPLSEKLPSAEEETAIMKRLKAGGKMVTRNGDLLPKINNAVFGFSAVVCSVDGSTVAVEFVLSIGLVDPRVS